MLELWLSVLTVRALNTHLAAAHLANMAMDMLWLDAKRNHNLQ